MGRCGCTRGTRGAQHPTCAARGRNLPTRPRPTTGPPEYPWTPIPPPRPAPWLRWQLSGRHSPLRLTRITVESACAAPLPHLLLSRRPPRLLHVLSPQLVTSIGLPLLASRVIFNCECPHALRRPRRPPAHLTPGTHWVRPLFNGAKLKFDRESNRKRCFPQRRASPKGGCASLPLGQGRATSCPYAGPSRLRRTPPSPASPRPAFHRASLASAASLTHPPPLPPAPRYRCTS